MCAFLSLWAFFHPFSIWSCEAILTKIKCKWQTTNTNNNQSRNERKKIIRMTQNKKTTNYLNIHNYLMAFSFELLMKWTLHKPNALVKQFNFHFNLDISVEQAKELLIKRIKRIKRKWIKIKMEQKSFCFGRFHEIPICYDVAVWEMLSRSMFNVHAWTVFVSVFQARHIVSVCFMFLFIFNVQCSSLFTVHSSQAFKYSQVPKNETLFSCKRYVSN